MTATHLILAACLAGPTQTGENTGAITGVVVNASRDGQPEAGAEVILQALQDGEFVPVAATTADDRGAFVFTDLPVGEDRQFLAGANKDGVHYPGERIRLAPSRPTARAALAVRDAVVGPSPLVALRHEIVIEPAPGLLTVTESIRVWNPSATCYVGQSREDKGSVTLRLGIPSNFEKVTFHKEFYGRRFALIDGTLVTTIPWPPGERELKFTYILPIEKQHQIWERPLDLPCADVRVSVVTAKRTAVSCNLAQVPVQSEGSVTYESAGTRLPAGHLVRLELGRLPVPFTAYARWVALGVLMCLILGAALWTMTRQRFTNRPESMSSSRSRRPNQPKRRLREQPLSTERN